MLTSKDLIFLQQPYEICQIAAVDFRTDDKFSEVFLKKSIDKQIRIDNIFKKTNYTHGILYKIYFYTDQISYANSRRKSFYKMLKEEGDHIFDVFVDDKISYEQLEYVLKRNL
jgi:hypothetical protein